MSDLTTPEGCESSVPAPPAATRARGGRQAPALSRMAAVYGLWAAVAVLYWPSAQALDALWRNAPEETYTHGYLVLLLSLWLIMQSRARLAVAPVRPVPAALAALVVCSGLWVWAWRAAIQEVHLLLLPLLLLTAIVAALGWRVGRLLAFPVGYLYFAVPLWGSINGIVRALSSWMTGALIWITGLPIYMQGNYVQLPGGTIEIADSCSGLHSLIIGLALAALYGEVMRDSLRRRIEWLAVMGILSLAINWVRIFIVVAAAYVTDMQSSLVRSHYWLGWWLFAAAFAFFLWWAGRRGPEPPQKAEDSAEAPGPSTDRTVSFAHLALVLGVLAVLPVVSYGMDWVNPAATPVAIDWPAAPEGWHGPRAVEPADWQPHFADPSGESRRTYTDASGQTVQVFAVAYRIQTQAGKLLGYHNGLLGENQLLRTSSTRIVSSRSGRWRETLVIDSDGARSLIWSRYRIGSHLFVHPRLSQLWYGLRAMARPPLSSLTALRTLCVPDCLAANARLISAADTLQPGFR